jgi:hypothetical protein
MPSRLGGAATATLPAPASPRAAAAGAGAAAGTVLSALQSQGASAVPSRAASSSPPPALNRRATGNKAALLLGLAGGAGSFGSGSIGGGIGLGGGGTRLRGGGSTATSSSCPPSQGPHPELSSLDALLSHPLSLRHFRAFLASKHAAEGFLFHVAVLRFQREMLARARGIQDQFVLVGSRNEINIPSHQREAILAQMDAPAFGMFDRAQTEVVTLLRGSFQEFLQSDALAHYLQDKMQQRIVLAQPEERMHQQ